MPDANSAIDLVSDILADGDLKCGAVRKEQVPAPVRHALDQWLASVNLEFKDVDDEVLRGKLHKDEREIYRFWVEVQEPEIFVAKVVIEGDQIIGVSSAGSE
jgi:hypothetical protein